MKIMRLSHTYTVLRIGNAEIFVTITL